MQTTLAATELGLLFNEAIYSFFVMSLVAIFDIYVFLKIALSYRRTIERSTIHGGNFELFRFIGFTMLLMNAMLLSIFLWTFSLRIFGFVSDWTSAFLFAASFFTTVGNFSVNLPVGWRLIPSLIAFSGLFSFAWATACSMSMARMLFTHLEKKKSI